VISRKGGSEIYIELENAISVSGERKGKALPWKGKERGNVPLRFCAGRGERGP